MKKSLELVEADCQILPKKEKKKKVVGGADDQVRQEMGERVKPIQVNLGCAANHKAFMFRPKILN